MWCQGRASWWSANDNSVGRMSHVTVSIQITECDSLNLSHSNKTRECEQLSHKRQKKGPKHKSLIGNVISKHSLEPLHSKWIKFCSTVCPVCFFIASVVSCLFFFTFISSDDIWWSFFSGFSFIFHDVTSKLRLSHCSNERFKWYTLSGFWHFCLLISVMIISCHRASILAVQEPMGDITV